MHCLSGVRLAEAKAKRLRIEVSEVYSRKYVSTYQQLTMSLKKQNSCGLR